MEELQRRAAGLARPLSVEGQPELRGVAFRQKPREPGMIRCLSVSSQKADTSIPHPSAPRAVACYPQDGFGLIQKCVRTVGHDIAEMIDTGHYRQ
jgi:hypothetical protein